MSVVGRAEGIDHGTPKGARQHVRRGVLPVCGPCEQAIAAEREVDARTVNTGLEPRFNTGPKVRADKAAAGARQVGPVRVLTPLERYRAARLLAARAESKAEFREFLDALGLTVEDSEADLPDLLAAAGFTAAAVLTTTSSTTPTTGDS